MARAESLTVSILLTAMVALGPVSTDLYLPSLPAIGSAFATDQGTVQLTLSVFLVGFAFSQLACGPLSDRFGRRPVILGGLALYLVASLACAAAPSIEVLIFARFCQAVGACVGPVLGRAAVRDIYGRERAARMLSYMGMVMALAPAFGPIIGGFIEAWFGWRANFVLVSAVGLTVLAATAITLPETNRWKSPDATRLGHLIGNYRSLLRHRRYVGYVLVVACTYSGIFSFISGSSFVLIGILGLDPEVYGFCFAAIVVGYMLGAFGSGRYTVRFGVERMVQLGTAIQLLGGVAGLALHAVMPPSVASIVAPVAVFMIGTGLAMPNAQAGAIGPFPRMAGAASALLGFCQMGLAAFVGIVVGHGSGESALSMMAAIALVALGSMLAYWLIVHPAPQLAENA
ncbi:multidrug effflux MFS transporter [Pelagibius sp. 7325]|uniref:multidrug effflux MFS transporter n=1 Tax=Pelagibius sp. 7325 TaxID=3131994 RepID=UPI0030EC42D9